MSQFAIPAITKPFNAEICLPGSKSIALRQLTIAALTNGVTQLHGLPPCDDIDAMLDCLTALGVRQTTLYFGSFRMASIDIIEKNSVLKLVSCVVMFNAKNPIIFGATYSTSGAVQYPAG